MSDDLDKKIKWVDRVSGGGNKEEASDERKQKLIDELKVILAKAESGMATAGDLEKARKLNKQLGGEFSSQIAEMERIVEKAEELKRANSISSTEKNIDPVTSADSYFAREEVKIARKAIVDMEDGKDVSDNIFIQAVKYLVSDDEITLREEAILRSEAEAEEVINRAIRRGDTELSKDDEATLNKIYIQENTLFIDGHKGKVAEEVIGAEFAKELCTIINVSEASPEIQRALPGNKDEVRKALVQQKQHFAESEQKMTSLAREELEDIKKLFAMNYQVEPEKKQKELTQNPANREKIIAEAVAKMKENAGLRNEVGKIKTITDRKISLPNTSTKNTIVEGEVKFRPDSTPRIANKITTSRDIS